MSNTGLHRFFLSIVIPSVLAITLFIISVFAFIIPSFEKTIMERKKEMISELTNTAWSLLEEYHHEYKNTNTSLEEAQELAASKVENMRYGKENKDYFWIINKHPTMIMHPYRNDLLHTDLTTYQDPNGVKLFVEAVSEVKDDGEGYIHYMWQWKDDSTRIVPKLSYVKEFKPWGWIIGTGIYLEDVKKEIKQIKGRLLRISLLITLIIIIILLFVIRESLKIERNRKKAESNLLLSKQKYKSLVEASTEGTLMILGEKIIFSNLKFSKLSGYDISDVSSRRIEDIFKVDWKQIAHSFDDPKKTISLETRIRCNNGSEKDVIISVSKIKHDGADGYIIVTKEVTQQQLREKETESLAQELQTSLLMMDQPIYSFKKNLLKCSIETPIAGAARLMTKKKSSSVFISKDDRIIGFINDKDLRERVLAKNYDVQRPVMEIMSSPVISIPENALLYEAILLFKNENVTHLGIINKDGNIDGVLSYEDIAVMQQNSVSYLIKEIEISEDIDSLVRIYQRVPVLINALLQSGDKTQNITHIISSISDAITKRVIELAIEDIAPPPCNFAFMVMGSEGRMEQTLSTDQDNAIIINNKEGPEAYSQYFLSLGETISRNLNRIGYRYCKGNIMAKNPKWVQPLPVWKQYFTNWLTTSDPQSILDANIFFDFRWVYGSKDLVTDLREHVNLHVDNKPVFFYHMAQSIIKFKPPINLFGNIVGNQASDQLNLDIKKVIHAIVGFIRLYALQNKSSETNTLQRLKYIYKQGIVTKSMYNELELSYNYLMQLRLRFQVESILQNEPPNNLIDVNKLTHIEIATLKKIFGEISNFQTKLNFDFGGSS